MWGAAGARQGLRTISSTTHWTTRVSCSAAAATLHLAFVRIALAVASLLCARRMYVGRRLGLRAGEVFLSAHA